MEVSCEKGGPNGTSRQWCLAMGLVGFAAAAIVAVNFVYASSRGCLASGWFARDLDIDTVVLSMISSITACITLAPLAIYLYKTAQREVPTLVHMAGAYFATSFLAFSCYVYLVNDHFCGSATPVLTWFYGLAATTFENLSFCFLAWMQVVKVRALEGTGAGLGYWHRRISWVWYAIIVSAIIKNVAMPLIWVSMWDKMLDEDLVPGAKQASSFQFPETSWYYGAFGLGSVLWMGSVMSYATSLSILTYVAVKLMWRARKHLKSNHDVASIYLKQMLTKNLWLTLVANIWTLSRAGGSLTCGVNKWGDGSGVDLMDHPLPGLCHLVLDAAVNGGCVLALSGLLSSSQNEQVLGFFSLANRLARLGNARKRVQKELGYDLGEQIKELEEPLTQSMLVYSNALQRLFVKEPEAMTQLMHLDSKRLYGGKLQSEGEAPDEEMDKITQPTNDVEMLLKEANEAQPLLRSKIAPEDVWITTSGSLDDGVSVDGSSVEVSGCRVARRNACLDHTGLEGLLAYADEALDPGAKRRARVMEKATFKYQDEWGRPQFDRVRDIARMALQFDTAEALLRVLPRIYDAFDVVEVENRFANPTALGWMDITLLVRMKLPSGASHIAELQVQLNEFANERREAHKHYKTIRSVIPSMGVRAEHVDAVQRMILEAIEGPVKNGVQSDLSKASLSTGTGSQTTSKSPASKSAASLDSIVPGIPSVVAGD